MKTSEKQIGKNTSIVKQIQLSSTRNYQNLKNIIFLKDFLVIK